MAEKPNDNSSKEPSGQESGQKQQASRIQPPRATYPVPSNYAMMPPSSGDKRPAPQSGGLSRSMYMPMAQGRDPVPYHPSMRHPGMPHPSPYMRHPMGPHHLTNQYPVSAPPGSTVSAPKSVAKATSNTAESSQKPATRSAPAVKSAPKIIGDKRPTLVKTTPVIPEPPPMFSSRPPRWTDVEVRCVSCAGVLYRLHTFSCASNKSQDDDLKRIVAAQHPNLKDACDPEVSPDPDKIKNIDWTAIAAHHRLTKMERLKTHPNTYCRKAAECMRRFIKLSGAAKGGAEKLGANKGPWTEAEDQKVRDLVAIHGPKKWTQIAQQLPGEFSKP